MTSGIYYRSPEFLEQITKKLTHSHKHTEESKKKLRDKHLGKKLSEDTKKKISLSQTGKKRKPWSEEHKKKLSLKMKGENGPNWRGGLTEKNKLLRKSFEFKQWRELVFKRDDWTCQECKVKGGRLHPHHLKSFSEFIDLRFDINNGLTLCESCHKKTENYGRNTNK